MQLPALNLAAKASGLLKRKRSYAPRLLCVQIETGQKKWYRLAIGERVEPIEDEEFIPDGPYFSVTNDDYRVEAPQRMTNGQATSLVARTLDTMDRVLVVNRSDRGAVYGTTLMRMSGEAEDALPVPLVMAVDAKLREAGQRAPLIAVVVFEKMGLAIFFAYNESGVLRHQVALSTENAEGSAYAFANTCGLPDTTPTILFRKDDILAIQEALPAFPTGGGLGSISLSKVLPVASRVAVIVALGTGGWAWSQYHAIQDIRGQIDEQHALEASANGRITNAVTQNPVGFAQALSADWKKALEEAAALWVAGGKSDSQIEYRTSTHIVTMPFKYGRGDSLAAIADDNAVYASLDKKPPQGCRRTSIEFTGNLYEVKSKYSCMGSLSNIARFGF